MAVLVWDDGHGAAEFPIEASKRFSSFFIAKRQVWGAWCSLLLGFGCYTHEQRKESMKKIISTIHKYCIFILLFFMCSGLSSGEEMPLWKNVGGWDIRVDTTLGNGCFTHQVYEGDTVLRIGVDKLNGGMYVLIGDDDWKSIELGKQYPLKIQMGDESPWDGNASAVEIGGFPMLMLRINKNESVGAFFKEFMEELHIEFWFSGNSIAKLTLKGSFKAGSELLECQRTVNKMNNTKNPFSNSKDPFREQNSKKSDPFAI